MKYLILIAVMFSVAAHANDWNSSPNNWENSSSNLENIPNNLENSPSNFAIPIIILDISGNPQGYTVPRSDCEVNIYNQDGSPKCYLPAR